MAKFDRPTTIRLTPQLRGAVEAYTLGTPLTDSDVIRIAVEHFLAPYTLRAKANMDLGNEIGHAPAEALRGAKI